MVRMRGGPDRRCSRPMADLPGTGIGIAVEGLENRSRRHNICIRGAPTGAEKEDFGEFVKALFRSILGPDDIREITLDRVRRAGRPGGTGDRPPDILACRRQEFKPITEHLWANSTSYSWGHHFRLMFCWEDQLRQLKLALEAHRILHLEEVERDVGTRAEAAAGERLCWRRKERKRKQQRPTTTEQVLERQSTYTRIDFFLASPEFTSRISETTIEPLALTDHAPITLVACLDVGRVGTPSWRFRDTILQSRVVEETLRCAITDYLSFSDDGRTSLDTLWEGLKAVVRGEVMSLSSKDNKVRREQRAVLEQKVAALERSHKYTGTPRVWRELEKARQQLKWLDWDRAEYAVVRLKHKYYTGSNRCGKLLAHRLRAQCSAMAIKMIRSPSEGEVRMDDQMAEVFAEYYGELYATDAGCGVDPAPFLADSNITPLGERDASSLDQPITVEEVISAISRLKAGKSPGPDGFMTLFYKTFCPELVPPLARLFNSFRMSGALTPSMLEATIAVIHKPGKDPEECASYRPISLLNIDAKLFIGILAHRLNPYMPGFIDPDQAGFIPHRQWPGSNAFIVDLGLLSKLMDSVLAVSDWSRNATGVSALPFTFCAVYGAFCPAPAL
ncbi:hypothetical protein NDU88_002368 [Pleurodeles waltl]|uniref:Reverse transcriptase domain-containing protein n=1 Tax=Pleurodeles waltl TaxID=8319 RepID=A0AAV7P6T2_PLEWA|nr:hypothetical protein NDU88_002368 [Pleurodeles waltl]